MLHTPTVRLDIDWNTTVTIIASCQLALRHPGNTGLTAATARAFVDELIDRIETVDSELAELLRMGDDPAADR